MGMENFRTRNTKLQKKCVEQQGLWFGWSLPTVLRPIAVKGLVILPKRWIVERTFAWINKYRRIAILGRPRLPVRPGVFSSLNAFNIASL